MSIKKNAKDDFIKIIFIKKKNIPQNILGIFRGIFHRIFGGIFYRWPMKRRHVASPEAATWPQDSYEMGVLKYILVAAGFEHGSRRKQPNGLTVGPWHWSC